MRHRENKCVPVAGSGSIRNLSKRLRSIAPKLAQLLRNVSLLPACGAAVVSAGKSFWHSKKSGACVRSVTGHGVAFHKLARDLWKIPEFSSTGLWMGLASRLNEMRRYPKFPPRLCFCCWFCIWF